MTIKVLSGQPRKKKNKKKNKNQKENFSIYFQFLLNTVRLSRVGDYHLANSIRVENIMQQYMTQLSSAID